MPTRLFQGGHGCRNYFLILGLLLFVGMMMTAVGMMGYTAAQQHLCPLTTPTSADYTSPETVTTVTKPTAGSVTEKSPIGVETTKPPQRKQTLFIPFHFRVTIR